jgi:acyl carrier protein
MTHSNDGEDQLIYQELMFDSLDMIEFILNIELEIGNDFHFDDDFINKDITLGKIIDYIYEHQ